MTFSRMTIGLEKPPNAENITQNSDFNAMRAAIMKGRLDSALISNLMNSADYMGLSGEDRYTAVAYHALIQLEEYAQRVLRFTELMPNPIQFMRPMDDGK